MSEEISDAPAGEPAAVYKISGEGPISVTDAADAIAKAREGGFHPEKKLEETPSETPETVEPDAAPPEEAPGDSTPEPDPAAELPPVEPPRSWSKADKEVFATFPREAQEKIALREQDRDTEVRRVQNEAAEKQKALNAQLAEAAKARQQYEAAYPQLVANMNAQIAGEFSDIKTWDDVVKLQAEDPLGRFQRYQLAQQRQAAARQELAAIQQRQEATTQQWWNGFAKDQDAKFTEAAPEMADPAKARALQENAKKVLKNVGFEDDLIAQSWAGKTGIPIRDHRFQQLVYKATMWDEAQAKAKVVRQTPLPQVVKPGTARNTQADADAGEITKLRNEMKNAKGNKAIDLGVRLQQLQRRSNG